MSVFEQELELIEEGIDEPKPGFKYQKSSSGLRILVPRVPIKKDLGEYVITVNHVSKGPPSLLPPSLLLSS